MEFTFEKVLSGISRDLVLLSTKPNQIQARNRILASGERLSAIVVANNLTNSNLPSIPVGAEDVGLKIQGHGAMKRVNLESSKLHLNLSKDSPIPVLTGWFGEGEDGEITLLSRGGSDHSASSIAKLISADRVILWKDIKGIQSLNPRWGIPTNTIPYLGYNEAITLAMYGGASVIHPFFYRTAHIKRHSYGSAVHFRTPHPRNNNVYWTRYYYSGFESQSDWLQAWYQRNQMSRSHK